jgi:tRNA(fMet)-specific endonuclease VapC
MIRYLLDTNACIGVINGQPPALRERLLKSPIPHDFSGD